jgi:Ca-activated chloride channel family protein
VKAIVMVGGLTLAAMAVLAVLSWRAGGFTGLWLTPDQQGRALYEQKDFAAAADVFVSPGWRGRAAYAAGRYADAADAFAFLTPSEGPPAEGLYNRGNALMKNREYAKAIASYELAVAETPEWPEAKDNLRLSRYVLYYIETSREESGTGGKLEADEFKFDNTRDRGEEMTITDRSTVEQQTAEKWMRSVDTRTSEFLAVRFGMEAGRTQEAM